MFPLHKIILITINIDYINLWKYNLFTLLRTGHLRISVFRLISVAILLLKFSL